jgi:hypothetical protein
MFLPKGGIGWLVSKHRTWLAICTEDKYCVLETAKAIKWSKAINYLIKYDLKGIHLMKEGDEEILDIINDRVIRKMIKKFEIKFRKYRSHDSVEQIINNLLEKENTSLHPLMFKAE